MTDFDYYTQFKFSQKEIDMLNFYINYEPAQADKNDAQNILNQVIEYNELMNNLNRNRIADQYKDYNLTTKIQAYEKKLLEKTNLYYDKAKRLIDDQITTETGLPETPIWKTVIENTY